VKNTFLWSSFLFQRKVVSKAFLSKKRFLVAAIAMVFLIAAIGSVSAVTVINSCNFNANTEGEYYVLGSNLTCSGSEHGIIIKANNVVIDGYNETDGEYYWIDGDVASCAGTNRWSGIYDWAAGVLEQNIVNVTIKNLEIKNFCNGIYTRSDPPDCTYFHYNWTIQNCSIHDNGEESAESRTTHGLKLECFYNSTIEKCEIYNNMGGTGGSMGCENGGNGIFLKVGDYNDIKCNRIYNNSKAGYFTKGGPMYTNVTYNNMFGNRGEGGEGGGIVLRCKKCRYFEIAYNIVSNNVDFGIFIGGYSNTIRNNIANDNDYGIYMGRSDGSYNNEIYENTVCGNGVEDIGTCGPECYGNHGDNNTCDTTSYYDDEGATGCTYLCSAGVIADFSAEPTKGTSPLEVAFRDRSKPEGDIIGWLWDFDDGNTSNEQNPTHTYSTRDPYSYYNVILTVTGSGGASDALTKTDCIKVWKKEAAPNADFHCPPGVGITSELVVFTDKSIGEVTSRLWDFGDGNTNTTQNPMHYYGSIGIYTVSLEVTGPGGSSKDTKFECVKVGEEGAAKRPLIDAHFFSSARSGNAPFTVTFTDVSRSASEIDSWKWNFGDGNISSEKNPTHRYNNAGAYNVSLEVTNTEDAKAKEIKIGYIEVKEEVIFDTGAPANSYPSIFGTHKGKIIPDKNITVNRLYTYPCEGTGGHAEYVRIWNESEAIEGIGRWSGYHGDYYNVTISPAITLLKNHEYNYTIITGSYPQIVHTKECKAVEGGNITCMEFTDANGKVYEDWIPAIRLYLD